MKRVMKPIALTLVWILVVVTLATPTQPAVAAKKVTVTKVTVSKPNGSTLILKKGKSYKLKTNVTVKPNNKKNKAVIYKSNKPSVVSVDKNGKLTALKSKGSAIITVRSALNAKKSAKLNVRIGTPVTGVSTSCSSTNMYAGNTLNLSKTITVSPKKATVKKVAWSSSRPKVATVKNGVVTGKGAGTTNIYAAATDGSGKRAVCKVTVFGRNTSWKTGTALQNVYKDNFLIGVAIPASTLINDSDESRLARYHFNSVTAENDMKPESLLDWQKSEENAKNGNEAPAIKFDTMDKMLDYAKANGLKVRFHTLVWFSQTPEWFFNEGYDTGTPLVSADVMKKRLESYITQIIDHVETKYPGLVYAWDVVNEAMASKNEATADKEHFYMRTKDNLWYQTIGWEYVKYAFQYAKNAISKYNGAGKLFYNDYMERTMRTEIIAMLNDVNEKEKLCDGMGSQAHFSINSDYKDYYKALQAYQEAGFEIHVTELDIGIFPPINNEGYEKQAGMYKTLFDMYRTIPAITSVTVWGVHDRVSWRRDTDPLLFDGNLTPKRAFYGAIQDPSVSLYAYR